MIFSSLVFQIAVKAQIFGNDKTIEIDTANFNLKEFAEKIIAGSSNNFEKAKSLLTWLSTNFAWTSTDYKNRTINEIIARKGGNCFELARVYMAIINEVGIKYRPIAEINLHKPSERRRQTAQDKIIQSGNKMSVFGYQHNDHRWVEVFDEEKNEWIPVDPTTNLIGFDQWLKGRAWFGERHTINDDISNDMIVPFAIFVVDSNDKSKMNEDRTQYYMVTKLNQLYEGRLSKLPSWKNWKEQLLAISVHAKNAFGGTENFHQYGKDIDELRKIYELLREELLKHKS